MKRFILVIFAIVFMWAPHGFCKAYRDYDLKATPEGTDVVLISEYPSGTYYETLSSMAGVIFQAYDADLTIWGTLTPSANMQSFAAAATYAAMRTLLDLEPGTDFYSTTAADSAFLEATQLDDTKGNGDTTFMWSADKIFDQLALKAPLASPTFTTDITVQGLTGASAILTMIADAGEDNDDSFRLAVGDGTGLYFQSYESGDWLTAFHLGITAGFFIYGKADTDPATLTLSADIGTDNNDKWRLIANDGAASDIESYTSGSWVDKFTVANDGDITTPGGEITITEWGYLEDVTSSVQDQIDGKQSTLTNETGLYSALSDVNNFGQTNKPENMTAAWIFNDDKGMFHGTDHDIWVGWDASDVRYAFKYLTDSTANTDEELDISETAITVDDSSLVAANEIIKVESEYMSVVSIDDGTTITVVRGALGSTAATHSTAKDIYWLQTIFAFDPANKTMWSSPGETPEIILSDSNNPGTDKDSMSFGVQYTDGADGSENNDAFIYINYGGNKTTIAKWDEDDLAWDFQAYDVVTSGEIVGRNRWGADVATTPVSHNTTALHGLMYLVTVAATVNLDAAADAGYGACVNYRIRDAAEAVIIDLDGSEYMNLAGTALAQGVGVTATGAGEYLTLCATTDANGSGADGWLIYGETSGWASQ